MASTSFRTTRELLDKLGYIAKYNDCSNNYLLERMLRNYVAAFEKKYGVITPEDILEMKNKKKAQ